MRRRIKTSKFLIAFILLFIIISANSYSQRCGDGILFSFTDNSYSQIESGKLSISGEYFDSYYRNNDAEIKSGMKLKYPEFYQVQKDTIYVSKFGPQVEWKDSTHFYIRTFCSMLLMRVNITFNDKKMQLNIYNIPGDIPFRLDNIPFNEGKFEVNLNGYIDYKNFSQNSDGTYILKFDKFNSTEQ